MKTNKAEKGIRNFWKKQRAKVMTTLSLSMLMAMSFVTSAFAAAPTPVPLDLTEVKSALTSNLNGSTIGEIISWSLIAGVPLMLIWFGARKLTKVVVRAFQQGKIKF